MPYPVASRLALPALASLVLATPGDELTLHAEPLAGGTELDVFEEVSYELDFDLSTAGHAIPGFEMSYERLTEKTVTVLRPGEEGPLAVRIVYHVVDEVEEGPGIDGDEIEEPCPLDGAVVTVQRAGSDWAVLDGEHEAGDELRELVLDEAVRRDELLYDLRMFVEPVTATPLREGAVIEIDELMAIELLDAALEEEGGVFEEAEMVLAYQGVEEHATTGTACARFEVDAIAGGEIPGDLEVAVDLSGELWLDLETACVVELVLEGEMAVSGDSHDVYGVELDGEGSFRFVLRVE